MSPTLKLLLLIGLLIVLTVGCISLGWLLHAWFGPSLPPATRRQLDRAARANRADLRALRIERGDPPTYVPIPLDHFDHGDTQ